MQPAIIVHGGAWDWPDELDGPKTEHLRQAARIGWDILKNGGSALDAVEAAAFYLEDIPLFDAGTGSHLNADGVVEMDALIVDGHTRNFGAVASVQRVRNPITLARKVMDETAYNFFAGAGADKLAIEMGLPTVPNISLVSEEELALFRQGKTPTEAHDTVGAVAIDSQGHIAAATSTGGTPHKPAGRVGDSPLYGAGGYADDAYGAAGATGKGEHSARVLLSRYAVDQIAAGMDAQAAAEAAMDHIDSVFATSMVGLIVVDHDGRLGAAHTTPKMAVGWIDADGEAQASVRGGLTTS